MKIFVLILLTYSICLSQKAELEDIDSSTLKTLIESKKGQKAVFVNFWATWCAPCVKELPDILNIKKKYEKSMELILVSFDFSENRNKALQFLEKKGVNFKTYFKNEPDEQFLNNMPDEWTGALPFTMIVSKNGNKMTLLEDEQSYHTFEKHVVSAIK